MAKEFIAIDPKGKFRHRGTNQQCWDYVTKTLGEPVGYAQSIGWKVQEDDGDYAHPFYRDWSK